MHALLFPLRWLSALAILILLSSVGAGQQPTAQRQDEDFARSVKEWTTKPEFISPLVDHLPRVAGIPSPKDVLGHHIGAPGKLTYHADTVAYYRALAAKTPRVKVFSIGTTDDFACKASRLAARPPRSKSRRNVCTWVAGDQARSALRQIGEDPSREAGLSRSEPSNL
jgi:uncharacterized protein YjiS (DUF1127 family)